VRDGVPVVEVLGHGPTHIELARLVPRPPSATDAEAFGRRLAATHRAGAPHHGAPPPGLGRDGFIAALDLPHAAAPMPWGRFHVELRLAPYIRQARDRGALDPGGARVLDRVCTRLADGDGELGAGGQDVARLHGDLWSGNVVWTPGPVLIDPAAHGGHREGDLAMLHLFGLPHLERVIAAYDETWPLAAGFEDRVGLHQLHPLLVHAVLFGAGYGRRAVAVAARYA
jgi:fructosamine-3-kinase